MRSRARGRPRPNTFSRGLRSPLAGEGGPARLHGRAEGLSGSVVDEALAMGEPELAGELVQPAWIPERSATRLREADLNALSKLGNQGLEGRLEPEAFTPAFAG